MHGQDNSKSFGWILMKPCGYIECWSRSKWFNFGINLVKACGQGGQRSVSSPLTIYPCKIKHLFMCQIPAWRFATWGFAAWGFVSLRVISSSLRFHFKRIIFRVLILVRPIDVRLVCLSNQVSILSGMRECYNMTQNYAEKYNDACGCMMGGCMLVFLPGMPVPCIYDRSPWPSASDRWLQIACT